MAPDVIEAAKAAIEALGYGPVLLTRLAARAATTTRWC